MLSDRDQAKKLTNYLKNDLAKKVIYHSEIKVRFDVMNSYLRFSTQRATSTAVRSQIQHELERPLDV
jgi:hypothetical protein